MHSENADNNTDNTDNDVLVITEEESSQRLDKILTSRFQGIRSRTYFQWLMDQKRVLVNGVVVKKRYIPKAGDEVQVYFILSPEIGLKAEPIPLSIIYEDDFIIVINKPAGMVVHPAVGNWTGTLVNALLYHCQQLPASEGKEALRPGIVHRLDKETSGLLIAAKTTLAQQRLIELFGDRKVKKEYLAICLGNPGNKEIRTQIGRHPVYRKMMAVLPDGGKLAVTHCKTLVHSKLLSLVVVGLETGRTHQIRVHMKHLGTPVLGDLVYGNPTMQEKYGISRQLLHAYRLEFEHPINGSMMKFEAPLPEDMKKMISISFPDYSKMNESEKC